MPETTETTQVDTAAQTGAMGEAEAPAIMESVAAASRGSSRPR